MHLSRSAVQKPVLDFMQARKYYRVFGLFVLADDILDGNCLCVRCASRLKFKRITHQNTYTSEKIFHLDGAIRRILTTRITDDTIETDIEIVGVIIRKEGGDSSRFHFQRGRAA